jgi:hypothetical protein
MRAIYVRRHNEDKTPKWLKKLAENYSKYRFNQYKRQRSTFYDYAELRTVQFIMKEEKNN